MSLWSILTSGFQFQAVYRLGSLLSGAPVLAMRC